jgi:cytidylate kinase
MIITIDGPAGTGKSTVAKKLAETLGFAYFDTGALYRAISWKILQEKISLTDREKLEEILYQFSFCQEKDRYFVNGEDVTAVIRSQAVTEIVSEVSAMKVVRDALKPIQIEFSKKGSVVFEGRDLGTVVFPHAEIKFFLTASPEVRAKRRLKELRRLGASSVTLEKVLEDIHERDRFDSGREIAPLKKPSDAIVIDTTHLSIEEVVNTLKKYV